MNGSKNHPPTAPEPRWTGAWWAAALAVVLGLLFYDTLLGPKGLVPADGVLGLPPWSDPAPPSNFLLIDQFLTFLPQHEFVHQQFLQGGFPLWNPFLDCGQPNLASMQGALLFPVNLLLTPISPFRAAALAAFLKLFLAGLFTLLYLRLLGASGTAAFLSGLSFSLSGFMIVWLGHPQANCAMCLPPLLFFLEKSFHSAANNLPPRFALRSWIGFALSYGALLLGGHPPTAIQLTLVIILYFLFRLRALRYPGPVRRSFLLLGSLATGFLLAAPQILPFLEYYQFSSAPMVSAAIDRSSFHLTPDTLLNFLLPHGYGFPTHDVGDLPALFGISDLPNFTERTGYVGILPLFLTLVALGARRCGLTLFFASVLIGSGLVIYGVPPLPALVRLVPMLQNTNPARLLLVVGFSFAVLAGFGWDALRNIDSPRKRTILLAVFLAGVICPLATFWISHRDAFPKMNEAMRAFLRPQFLVLLTGLLVAALMAWGTKSKARWLLPAVVIIWTAADLLWFASGYNPAITRDQYYPTTPAIAWLQKNAGSSRIFGVRYTLPANTAACYGLQDVRGNDFTTVRRYEELVTGKAGDQQFFYGATQLPHAFKLLNLKYLLLPPGSEADTNDFELLYTGEMTIYRCKKTPDRALVLHDYEVEASPENLLRQVRSPKFNPAARLLLEEIPQGFPATPAAEISTPLESSAQISSRQPDQLVITATSSRPGFLLLLDTWFPGWTATVNGHRTPIYRADYNFRAVAIPAGHSTVHFSYRPRSLHLGLILCLAGFCVIIAGWFWSRKPSATNP